MKRREFLKLAGLTGLAVASPFAGSPAWAQESVGLEPYEGPLYLIIHCGGGWDPTSFCDPKGTTDPEDPERVNNFLIDEIRSPSTSSPIRWAPFGSNEEFFSRYYDRLMVLNGLDTSTNNHDVGPRHIHSGTLAEGHPAFAALVAGTHARTSPLSFITNGGYDITRGLVPRTRVGNLDAIQRIAFPNAKGDRVFHSEDSYNRIIQAQQARLQRLQEKQNLPRLKRSMGTLMTIRSSGNLLQRLTEFLPDLNAFGTGLGRQAALAISAWRAGLCVSANLSTGGFDTHGNHDQNHANSLSRLTDGLVEIMRAAEEQGVEDKVVLMVGSDFGRTPWYNDGNGKDHWSITSMIMMGPGIPGNTVVGATTDKFRAEKLNPATLQKDDDGVTLKPIHVQRSLRRLANVSDEWNAQFPLPLPPGEDKDLDIFG